MHIESALCTGSTVSHTLRNRSPVWQWSPIGVFIIYRLHNKPGLTPPPRALGLEEPINSRTHEMMMPLSMEKLSEGRPALVQALIFTGSPRDFIRDMAGEQGISLLSQRAIHSSVWH